MGFLHFSARLAGLMLLGIVTVYSGEQLYAFEKPPKRLLDSAPEHFSRQFLPRIEPTAMPDKPTGLLTPEQWGELIDATWGPGLSWDTHQDIWITFWINVDQHFA